ncbi:hypothetical protein L195_g031211, partial [Trifolium pratense]
DFKFPMAEEQNDTTVKGRGPWDPKLAALLSSVVMILKQQNDTPGIPKVAITGKTAIAYMIGGDDIGFSAVGDENENERSAKMVESGLQRGTKRKRLEGLQYLLDSEVAAFRATVGKNNKEDGTEKIV